MPGAETHTHTICLRPLSRDIQSVRALLAVVIAAVKHSARPRRRRQVGRLPFAAAISAPATPRPPPSFSARRARSPRVDSQKRIMLRSGSSATSPALRPRAAGKLSFDATLYILSSCAGAPRVRSLRRGGAYVLFKHWRGA